MPTEFIKDIIPYMSGLKLTYVDIGAYDGATFAKFYNSELCIKEAHLFEPNNINFKKLQKKYDCEGKCQNIHLHNIALSSHPTNELFITQNESMSKVYTSQTEGDERFTVQPVAASTLDLISQNFLSKHISILKIDVEGYEMSVFKGMTNLLSTNSVDIIYIEAGLNKENTQQTYYRDIEDFLLEYDFGIFKIYEQIHEWPTDSPLLRRINIAFMSKSFAQDHPFKYTRRAYTIKKFFTRRKK